MLSQGRQGCPTRSAFSSNHGGTGSAGPLVMSPLRGEAASAAQGGHFFMLQVLKPSIAYGGHQPIRPVASGTMPM